MMIFEIEIQDHEEGDEELSTYVVEAAIRDRIEESGGSAVVIVTEKEKP
jgi:hypothetical protein